MGTILGKKPTPVDGNKRIYIPTKVLNLLEVEPGADSLYFELENGRILINKAQVNYDYIKKLIKE